MNIATKLLSGLRSRSSLSPVSKQKLESSVDRASVRIQARAAARGNSLAI